MKLERFTDPEVFQDRVIPFLVRREAENNLPLGITANLVGGEFQEQPPYLAVVEERGKIVLAALRTPPFPVLFSYHEPPPDQEILRMILDDLGDVFGTQLSGVTANQSLAKILAEDWAKRTGMSSVLERAMRIYKLDTVIQPERIPGSLREPLPPDRELLEEWYAGFHREALGEEQDANKVKKQIEKFLSSDPGQRGLRIWEVDGKPVSMAGYSGPTPHGIRIGAVYTPADQRRKGYASACVAALSQEMLDQDFNFCFLFTDLQNPTSNHIYQQIGYRPVVDVDSYRFLEDGAD